MNFKTIYDLITYCKESYGIHQIRIDEDGVKSRLYYFWEVIPETILRSSFKEWKLDTVKDKYGLNHRELRIVY